MDKHTKSPKNSSMGTLQYLIPLITFIFVSLGPVRDFFFPLYLQQDLSYDNKNQGVNSRHGSL